MRTLNPSQMRRLELNAVDAGVPVARLMARAGQALARRVLQELPDADERPLAGDEEATGWPEALFLCGKGNNGGDGLAAAGILRHQGRRVEVWLTCAPEEVRGPEAKAYLQAISSQVIAWAQRPRRTLERAAHPTVVVDCMLGSGTQGAPRGTVRSALAWLATAKTAGSRIIACDIPSGVGSKAAVVPHATVTFHAAKEGMSKRTCGLIEVADIGIPAEADDIGVGDLKTGYVPQSRAGHKGDHGVVAIVAGGPYTGAPWYTAQGALRAGADLALLATPRACAEVIHHWGPGPIIHALGDGDHVGEDALVAIRRLLQRADCLVIGPGLGDHPDTLAAATRAMGLAAQRDVPVVVDADGLDALTPALLRRHGARMVLTPHGGEFRDLLALESRWPKRSNAEDPTSKSKKRPEGEAELAFAARWNTTVCRKGATDIITDGTHLRRCRRGHPAMSVGGTGDVLAGVIGCLIARGSDPFEAACAATYLVGVAGERAAATWGPGLSATEVHEAIPGVLVDQGP